MTFKKSFLEKLTASEASEKEIEARENGKNYHQEVPIKNWHQAETDGHLPVDVFQTPADIIIKSTIAGVKPEHLDIALTNDMITIQGKRDLEEETHPENYFYRECHWGQFSRSIILPVDVHSDKAVAVIKNGILTIRLPKLQKDSGKTKKIEVVNKDEE